VKLLSRSRIYLEKATSGEVELLPQPLDTEAHFSGQVSDPSISLFSEDRRQSWSFFHQNLRIALSTATTDEEGGSLLAASEGEAELPAGGKMRPFGPPGSPETCPDFQKGGLGKQTLVGHIEDPTRPAPVPEAGHGPPSPEATESEGDPVPVTEGVGCWFDLHRFDRATPDSG
jgi:hypothetical protein